MAPDLNTVPASPRPAVAVPRATTSRRTSQQMAPPALPLSSATANILPSNQNAVNNAHSLVPSGSSVSVGPGDNTGVGSGPGPLRHPRPLTAADIHLQLEKEQEAVVNRLTRELSLLRAAQNASVVSNSSSTSVGFPDPADHNANHMLSGPSHPTPSQRHHRSSSSASTRSITAGTTASGSTAGWTTAGVAGSISSVFTPTTMDRTQGSFPRHDSMSHSRSRQNSTTSSRRSGASSPVISHYADNPLRPSFSQHREPSGPQVTLGNEAGHASITSVQTTARYEEVAYHRHELDVVKRENDALRRRVQELERTLRERRRSDASFAISETLNTTASISARDLTGGLGRGRETEKDQEDVVRVGESARSGGLN